MGMRDAEAGVDGSGGPSFIGRIVGRSVSEITFRAVPEARVRVGDLLVAEDDAAGERFLLRVIDVRYGAEPQDPGWMERAAGTLLRREGAEIPDREALLFVLGVCVPLGYVRDGRFRKAKTVPEHFARVRRASMRDYDFLAPFMGDVEVGFLRSGEDVVPIAVGVHGDSAFPQHIGVFATTGMGKSNLMKALAASCVSLRRHGVLLFDPHGEYVDGGGLPGRRGLAHHPRARDGLSVYAARKLATTPHRRLQISAHEVSVADLLHIYEFSGPQAELLDAARHRFGPSWLVDVHERSPAELAGEFEGHFHEGTIHVVKRRIQRIFRHGLVHRDPSLSASKAVLADLREAKVVLVDTGGMQETEELLVATVLARAVFEANKAAYGEPGFADLPPVLVTLEEAQRVLGRGVRASGNVFAQIAREGRKFKTGLCAITQQPKLLDTEVASQLNTLFILGLADARDREILQDSAKQDVSRLENEIQSLMPGEALIASPAVPFAVPVAVHLFEDHLERIAAAEPAPAAPSKVAVAPAGDFYG